MKDKIIIIILILILAILLRVSLPILIALISYTFYMCVYIGLLVCAIYLLYKMYFSKNKNKIE